MVTTYPLASEPIAGRIHTQALDLIPDKVCLHSMWEDSDIPGQDTALELARWIERYSQGGITLILAGVGFVHAP